MPTPSERGPKTFSAELQLIRPGWLGPIAGCLERPIEPQDVSQPATVARIESGLAAGLRLSSILIGPEGPERLGEIEIECLVSLLLLCGEHAQSNVWTSSDTLRSGYQIQAALKQAFHVERLSQILEQQPQVCQRALADLRAKLSPTPGTESSQWRIHVGTIACFMWFLDQLVGSANLSQRWLGDMFPFLITLEHDWLLQHQILGIQGLHKVVEHGNLKDLIQFGRWSVILSVFEHKMHFRELDLLKVLYPAYVCALTKMEHHMESEDSRFNETDQFTATFLANLALKTTSPEHRELHLSIFPDLLTLLDFRLQRWLQRIIDMLGQCLDSFGLAQDEAVQILKAFQAIITMTEGNIAHHVRDILEPIARLAFEGQHKPGPIETEITAVIALVKRHAETELQILTGDSEEFDLSPCLKALII